MSSENIMELSVELCVEQSLLSSNRLRWACRRGMLELDIFLGDFLDSGYAELSESEKYTFQEILLEADQTLFGYLMGQNQPEDSEIANVITKIRIAAAA